MFIEKFYRRMAEAGGIGDGGSGAGGAGDAGDTPPAGGTGEPTEYVGPEWAKEWDGVAELEADVLNDPSLKVFNNPTALLKSYVHAQKQLGKKGVMIPSENSPKEEWDQFYAKIGVPLEDQKYFESTKLPSGEENKLGDDFSKEYLKLAHEMRVQPSQAAKMYEFFNTQIKAGADKQLQDMKAQTDAELNKLVDEWGEEAFGVKVNKATNYLKETMGEDFVKYLGQSGLGRNTQLIRAFATLAEKAVGEGEIPKGDSSHGMTIADLERETNNVYMNFDDPYHKPNHPDHKRRVDEVLAMNRKLEQARTRK